MRLSIPQHHRQFISALATELGATETEALNYLLWQYRRPAPNTSSKLVDFSEIPETTVTPLLGFKPAFEPKTPQAIRQFEDIQLQQEIDPIISRIAGLIEDF